MFALVNTVNDLGILIDSQLKLDLHINSMIANAHARACLIFRCFISKDYHSLIKAFITYLFIYYLSAFRVRQLCMFALQRWFNS